VLFSPVFANQNLCLLTLSLEGLPFSPLRPAVFFPNLQPSSLPTFQRSVSHPPPLRAPKSRRINTCKSLSKQRTLTIFRMIDLEKIEGVGDGGAMANQLSPDLRIPSFRRVPELSPSCSIPYKLPIFYPICFDIHPSDGGCRGSFRSILSQRSNVPTFRRCDVPTFRRSYVRPVTCPDDVHPPYYWSQRLPQTNFLRIIVPSFFLCGRV